MVVVSGVYNIDVQKRLGTEYWTNRYHCVALTLEEALQIGLELSAKEAVVTVSEVSFVSVRASTPQPNDGVYLVEQTNYSGGVVTPTHALPLFVVVRVTFTKGPGAPDVKYYKGMANPDALADAFNYKQATVNALQIDLAAALLATEGLSSQAGLPYTNIKVDQRVGMRQLRRGSKKRDEPVIPIQ